MPSDLADGGSGDQQGPEIVSALLRAGADPNAEGEDGRTALMMTEENEDPEARTAIVELLKNRGAAT